MSNNAERGKDPSIAYPLKQREADAPPLNWTRLQKLVWTMRKHGNSAANLNLQTLAKHNSWTSADELLVEFKIQENGSNKLPEEIAAASHKAPSQEESEE